LGATVDTFVEMNRADFIENITQLEKDGAIYETIKLSLNKEDINSQYVKQYVTTFKACSPWNSKVNSSIVARLEGLEGNVIPPLLLNHNSRKVLNAMTFMLDDYLTNYYLINLQHVMNKICYLILINNVDNSDDIDSIIMKLNDTLYPENEPYNNDISYIQNGIYEKINNLSKNADFPYLITQHNPIRFAYKIPNLKM
jgi:hypothetical protein